MASDDRHPRRKNTISKLFHSPLIIPSVPVNFAKIKRGRGLAKDFAALQDSHTRSSERKSFLQMHEMNDFDGKRFMI